jgi:hypothetical protein
VGPSIGPTGNGAPAFLCQKRQPCGCAKDMERVLTKQSLTCSGQGYNFIVNINLPTTYPFKPPTVAFATKIYHPNISNDSPPSSGTMCLGMLKESDWKPSTKIASVLEFARQLLKGKSFSSQGGKWPFFEGHQYMIYPPKSH